MAQRPEYLRPVSPLHYEPIDPLPHQTYLEDDSSTEQDIHHVAKRRRIEAIGERYLRGLPVVISTASLRGPFNKGWENPWSKSKKNKRQGLTAKEVPETIQRGGCDTNGTLNPGKKILSPPSGTGRVEVVSAPIVAKVGEESMPSEVPADGKKLEHVAQDDPFHSNPAQRSKSKVEDWLRKDNRVMRPRTLADAEGPLSPTARFTAVNSGRIDAGGNLHQTFRDLLLQNDENGRPHSNHDQPDLGAASKDRIPARPEILTAANTLSKRHSSEPRRPKGGDGALTSRSNSPVLLHKAGNEARHNCSKEDEKVTKDTGELRQRVPRATDGRRSLHALPPSTSLPGFEYRPVKRSSRSSDNASKQDGEAKPEERISAHPASGRQFLDELPLKDNHEEPSNGNYNINRIDEQVMGKVATTSNDVVALQEETPAFQAHPSTGRVLSGEKAELNNVSNARKMLPPPPSLTTETSNKSDTTITTNHLPSAQVLPPQQNPTLAPSLPSLDLDTATKISGDHPELSGQNVDDSILLLSTQAAVARAQEKFQAEAETPPNLQTVTSVADRSVDFTDKPSSTDKITPLRAFVSKRQVCSDMVGANEPDTQAVLDAATPFAFSTEKKIPTKPADESNAKPTNSRKLRSQQGKRASLANDTQISSGSSNGSVKGVMKVQKGGMYARISKEYQPASIPANDGGEALQYNSPGLDMETSVEDVNATAKGTMSSAVEEHHTSPRIRPSAEEQKRPPEPTSSTLPLTSNAGAPSLSSGQQHDAQQRTPLADRLDINPTVTEDSQGFDLEAALADMGSFLQTWDAEKEATSLASSSSSAKDGTRSKSSSWRLRARGI